MTETKTENVQEWRKCSFCGKVFDLWDVQNDFSIQRNVGYGSVHDGERVELRACCSCFDRLVEFAGKDV